MLRREHLRVVAINAAVLLVLVVIAEAIFGHWLRPVRLNNALIMRGVTVRFDITDLYPAPQTYATYTRDELGLRGRYRSLDTIDLLTIGGSTTDQRFVGDGLTFQDRLAERFRAAGRELSVVNAGVDGQTSYGHLRNFDVWFAQLPGFAPRAYLYYVGINDMHVPPDYGGGAVDSYDDFDGQRIDGLKEQLRQRSALYALFTVARGLVWTFEARAQHGSARLEGLVYHRVPDPVPPLDEAQAAKVRAYRRRLDRLFARTRAFTPGARLVCVTQTAYGITRRDAEGALWAADIAEHALLAAMNAQLLEACAAHQGLGLDLAGELSFEADDFYDVWHTTPSGSRKIGDYLFEALSAAGVFKPGG